MIQPTADPRYTLDLSVHDVVELIVALEERQEKLRFRDATLEATCDLIRSQLVRQGAFEYMATWYADLTGAERRTPQ